jgi:hypothetical protein
MVDGTMTPPRDGGPPGGDELVARVIPLRRRGEVAGGEPVTALPPATASSAHDAAGEPAPAFADRDMWEDRASQLPVREPALTRGLRSPHDLAAPHAGGRLRGRHVSRTRLGIAALAVVLVAAAAVAVASSGPHAATRAAHVANSKSAPAVTDVSAAKGVAARATAARAALRAARKRGAATAARKRTARVARAHALALSRARATRAKQQRAQTPAHERASEANPTPTVAPAKTPAPAVTGPVVTGPQITSARRPQAPAPSVAPARGEAASSCVPGELGC